MQFNKRQEVGTKYNEREAAAIRAIAYANVQRKFAWDITLFVKHPAVTAMRRYSLQLQYALSQNQPIEVVLQALSNLLHCRTIIANGSSALELPEVKFSFPVNFIPASKTIKELLPGELTTDFSDAIAGYLKTRNPKHLVALRNDHYDYKTAQELDALKALQSHIVMNFGKRTGQDRQQAFVEITPIIAHVVRDWTYVNFIDDMDLNYLNALNEFRLMANASHAYSREVMFAGFLKLIWSCKKEDLRTELIQIANCFAQVFHLHPLGKMMKTADARWDVPHVNFVKEGSGDSAVLAPAVCQLDEYLQLQLELTLSNFGKLLNTEGLAKIAMSNDSAMQDLFNLITVIQSKCQPEVILHFAKEILEHAYNEPYDLLVINLQGTLLGFDKKIENSSKQVATSEYQQKISQALEAFKQELGDSPKPKVLVKLKALECKIKHGGLFEDGDCYITLQELLLCDALNKDLEASFGNSGLTPLQNAIKALTAIEPPYKIIWYSKLEGRAPIKPGALAVNYVPTYQEPILLSGDFQALGSPLPQGSGFNSSELQEVLAGRKKPGQKPAVKLVEPIPVHARPKPSFLTNPKPKQPEAEEYTDSLQVTVISKPTPGLKSILKTKEGNGGKKVKFSDPLIIKGTSPLTQQAAPAKRSIKRSVKRRTGGVKTKQRAMPKAPAKRPVKAKSAQQRRPLRKAGKRGLRPLPKKSLGAPGRVKNLAKQLGAVSTHPIKAKGRVKQTAAKLSKQGLTAKRARGLRKAPPKAVPSPRLRKAAVKAPAKRTPVHARFGGFMQTLNSQLQSSQSDGASRSSDNGKKFG